jgi:hypothetical protein
MRRSIDTASSGAPLSSTRPVSGGMKPDTTLNKVVLPAPLGPIKPCSARDATDKETPSTARSASYDLDTPSMRSIGASETARSGEASASVAVDESSSATRAGCSSRAPGAAAARGPCARSRSLTAEAMPSGKKVRVATTSTQKMSSI